VPYHHCKDDIKLLFAFALLTFLFTVWCEQRKSPGFNAETGAFAKTNAD
jgi:hypothetical protein